MNFPLIDPTTGLPAAFTFDQFAGPWRRVSHMLRRRKLARIVRSTRSVSDAELRTIGLTRLEH